MLRKRQVVRENQQLKGEVRELSELLKSAVEVARLGSYALAENVPPSKEDIERLGQDYPSWSIAWKTVKGENETKVVKTFRRDIGDLKPDLHSDHDIYKRFGDGEYFDQGLVDVFAKTSADPRTYWFGDGVFYGKADGRFGGGHFEVSVEGETSLTKLDLIRVEAAERYLTSQNLFRQPVPA